MSEDMVKLLRRLDKSNHKDEIKLCAFHFRKSGEHSYANEAYLKLGDLKA